MPINAGPEFMEAQKKYEEARTTSDKIICLKEMLSTAPSHKGAEKLRRQLTTRLAKLKQELEKEKKSRKGRKSLAVKKIGFQIVIIGFTNSGKSTLLKKLTNAEPKIAGYAFTTKEPEVGMLDFKGGKLQLVEVPALRRGAAKEQGELMSIVLNSDGILLLYKNEEERRALMKELFDFKVNKPVMFVESFKEVKKKDLFNFFDLIKVYTKEPGEEVELTNPLVLKRGTNVLNAGRRIHKAFVRKFLFARVWGSSRFPGQRVDKDFILKDGDVIEFHLKK